MRHGPDETLARLQVIQKSQIAHRAIRHPVHVLVLIILNVILVKQHLRLALLSSRHLSTPNFKDCCTETLRANSVGAGDAS